MTPTQLDAIRSVLGPYTSEDKARQIVEALRPSILRDAMKPLERLASMEAFTNSFYVGDSSAARELVERIKYAEEAVRAMMQEG